MKKEIGGDRNILREVKQGGKEGIRRSRSQTWSQVQHFPSASELQFIIKKFQWEQAESKPEVTERRARASSLPSCLPSVLSPSLSGPWLGHLHSAFSPSSLRGVRAAHVCRQVGNVNMFERHRHCNQSEWNPKTQLESEGDRLSPLHVKTKKHQRETLFCVFVVV